MISEQSQASASNCQKFALIERGTRIIDIVLKKARLGVRVVGGGGGGGGGSCQG